MATWNKLFSNFAWKNRPDTSTPLGQTLLNRLNTALNGIDDRVVALNAEKASVDEIQGVFTDVRLVKNTGQFVFTLYDGTEKIIDTALEKISINVSFDQDSQMLVLEKEDGSKEYVDLSAFTTQYEFASSPTIQQTVTDGKVTANIKPNSITDQMLQTNYLSDITTQANTALSASQSALESQSLAEQHAEDAEASADRAEEAANRAESVVGITIDTELSTESTNPIANKAVAVEFRKYFPKSGGYLSGNVTVQKTDASEARYTVQNSLRTASLLANGSGELGLYDTAHGFIFKSTADGTNTFNGTARGNVAKNGDANIKGTAHTPLILDTTYSDSDLVRIGFYQNGVVRGFLGILNNEPTFTNSSYSHKTLLHTGNKPTGTYTGNGDATGRTISTGGIGKVVAIWSENGTVLVSPWGAICFYGGTVVGLGGSTVGTTNNGVYIRTTNEYVNKSGVEYTYQVL